MAELGGPTYAPLTPANPTIINGLAAVDMQTGHPQQVMGGGEHGLVSMVAATVMPPPPATPDQNSTAPTGAAPVAPGGPALQQDAQANTVDRHTLVAVLQFLKNNGLKVRRVCALRGTAPRGPVFGELRLLHSLYFVWLVFV